MQFNLSACSLTLLLSVSCITPVIAASNPPLDLIELLGEIDEDEMLEAALSALEQTNPKKLFLPNKTIKKTLK
ncbi:MAG: hypothetical protein CTY38_11275 [Methylotenera sp.]|uniref:hypothetical protein n=1 Tax=Methylotenera sp. TaxID=2051956 RepID=UPI000D4D57DA|nr:hypothetical protein [Methylotenera sp.]PPC80334.1 MAG: hypothetical protein CTY38_11275 [Methylotenera sp.]